MPLKSKRQARWMFANHPKMAKRWAKKTAKQSFAKSIKQLPERKKKRRKR